MLFLIAVICCAFESRGLGLSTLSGSLLVGVVLVVQAAVLGRGVALPCTSFDGQNFAMCPCWWQQKHRPLAESFFHSSLVSFFRGDVMVWNVDMASTSIGTMPLLRGALHGVLVLWYC